ncbi:MAG: hypothetical protein GY703_24955, partial [Gammaproteobacteria bacterium]|nr:hypothetical protein [Gammaproteobacteria bacterium]
QTFPHPVFFSDLVPTEELHTDEISTSDEEDGPNPAINRINKLQSKVRARLYGLDTDFGGDPLDLEHWIIGLLRTVLNDVLTRAESMDDQMNDLAQTKRRTLDGGASAINLLTRFQNLATSMSRRNFTITRRDEIYGESDFPWLDWPDLIKANPDYGLANGEDAVRRIQKARKELRKYHNSSAGFSHIQSTSWRLCNRPRTKTDCCKKHAGIFNTAEEAEAGRRKPKTRGENGDQDESDESTEDEEDTKEANRWNTASGGAGRSMVRQNYPGRKIYDQPFDTDAAEAELEWMIFDDAEQQEADKQYGTKDCSCGKCQS